MNVYAVMQYDDVVGSYGIVGIYASFKVAEEVRKQMQDKDNSGFIKYEIETYDLKGEENKSMEDKILVQFYDNIELTLPFLMALTQDQIKILKWLEDHKLLSGGFSIMTVEEP